MMKKSILLTVFVLAYQILLSQEIFINNGEAIRGYDVVAYFKDSKPVLGSNRYQLKWKGATWKFSSAQNLNDFKASPEKYAPQFGGYCAYGTAEGHKAPTSADAWTIVDGKLFLNYDAAVKDIWNKDRHNLIEQANKNWPSVKLQED
jgi:YHS domain-containing protein